MSPSPVAKIAPSTTLMRENDLIPSILDLENLFDTDEEVDSNSVSHCNVITSIFNRCFCDLPETVPGVFFCCIS
jgi:hypothetical protein